jgi:hypothetical protein
MLCLEWLLFGRWFRDGIRGNGVVVAVLGLIWWNALSSAIALGHLFSGSNSHVDSEVLRTLLTSALWLAWVTLVSLARVTKQESISFAFAEALAVAGHSRPLSAVMLGILSCVGRALLGLFVLVPLFALCLYVLPAAQTAKLAVGVLLLVISAGAFDVLIRRAMSCRLFLVLSLAGAALSMLSPHDPAALKAAGSVSPPGLIARIAMGPARDALVPWVGLVCWCVAAMVTAFGLLEPRQLGRPASSSTTGVFARLLERPRLSCSSMLFLRELVTLCRTRRVVGMWIVAACGIALGIGGTRPDSRSMVRLALYLLGPILLGGLQLNLFGVDGPGAKMFWLSKGPSIAKVLISKAAAAGTVSVSLVLFTLVGVRATTGPWGFPDFLGGLAACGYAGWRGATGMVASIAGPVRLEPDSISGMAMSLVALGFGLVSDLLYGLSCLALFLVWRTSAYSTTVAFAETCVAVALLVAWFMWAARLAARLALLRPDRVFESLDANPA